MVRNRRRRGRLRRLRYRVFGVLTIRIAIDAVNWDVANGVGNGSMLSCTCVRTGAVGSK